ncbi:hypothetical protein T484DRAFT_1842462 [Baffinella frigidus]|nr:hypothetical protein T484DRAFT_1842462 [Cryptophyta sp. CCMP2293]
MLYVSTTCTDSKTRCRLLSCESFPSKGLATVAAAEEEDGTVKELEVAPAARPSPPEEVAKKVDVAEPSVKPVILPIDSEKKPVTMANSSAWASLAGDEDEDEDDEPASASQAAGAQGGSSSQLWSQFQNKDQLNKQRELEKKEEETRAKAREVEDGKRREEAAREQDRKRREAEEEGKRAAEAAVDEERKAREAAVGEE